MSSRPQRWSDGDILLGYREVEQMKLPTTAAWLTLIGISVSACASSTPTPDTDNNPPAFALSNIDSINKVNKPPYGQSSERSALGP
jgi:hypothetical protein